MKWLGQLTATVLFVLLFTLSTSAQSCGDTIASDTTLSSDLLSCSGNGLIIGADDITLDCSGYSITGPASGTYYAVLNNGYDNVTVQNCVITNFYHSIFYNGSVASYIDSGLITSNTISDSQQDTVRLVRADRIMVSNNQMTDIGDDGVESLYGDYSIYSGNVMDTVGDDGIRITGSGSELAQYNNVSGNTIFGGCGEDCFYFDSNFRNNLVWNNRVCEGLSDISNYGTNNSGYGNSCNITYGSWNDDGTTGCTYSCAGLTHAGPVLQDVTLLKDITGGLVVMASDMTVDCAGNTLSSSGGGQGIRIENRDEVNVRNCIIDDFQDGIYVDHSADHTFTNNTITFCSYGMNIRDNTSGISITDNTITSDGGGQGIQLAGNLHTVSSNTFSSGVYGLHLSQPSHHVLVSDNTISNYTQGLLVSNGNTNITVTDNWVCGNDPEDIQNSSIVAGTGNACNLTITNYNDVGQSGCTYTCGTTQTQYSLFSGWNLINYFLGWL